LVALSALGYASNPIIGKYAYEAGTTAISLMTLRFTFATVMLWLLVFTRPRQALGITTRIRLLSLGGVGFAAVALLYFTALNYMDASLITGLFYTYPAMVALIGAVGGKTLSRASYAGLLLTAVGTWLLLGADFSTFTWEGSFLTLVAAVVYAVYVVVSERWSRGIDPVVTASHVTTGASIVFLALFASTDQAVPGWPAVLAGSSLALLSTVLALVVYFTGLVRVGSMQASIISTLEPAFTALLALALLGERLSLVQALGICLVMIGAAAAQVRASRSAATRRR